MHIFISCYAMFHSKSEVWDIRIHLDKHAKHICSAGVWTSTERIIGSVAHLFLQTFAQSELTPTNHWSVDFCTSWKSNLTSNSIALFQEGTWKFQLFTILCSIRPRLSQVSRLYSLFLTPYLPEVNMHYS